MPSDGTAGESSRSQAREAPARALHRRQGAMAQRQTFVSRLLDPLCATFGARGRRYSCNYTLYDGAAYTTGQASGLTKGNVSEQDTYTGCGTTPSYTPSGKVGATTSYDPYGNATASQDPDAYSGDAAHKGAPGTSCAGNTTCAQYDGTTQAKTTGSSNAGNLTSASGYDTTPAYGFGLWPKTTTDANGQTTTYTYDALGRMLTMVAPGQTSGPATQTTAYYNVCGTTSPSSPCVEVDTTTRTSGSSSVLSRQFYDGENRLVETRTAAPGGQDVVQYTLYNAAGQAAQSSVKYFVTAYTGPGGVAAAYSTPDSTQDGTLTAYDGLGRMTQATDALSNVGKISYSIVCNAPGTSDAACYEQTLAVDPNSHQQGSLSDAFGRAIYAQRYSGASAGTYAVSSTAKTSYDSMGRVTQTQQPDGHTATASYDAAGHLTSATDPDRGLTSFAYDSNGNLTQQTDARCGTSLPQTACSAGTAFTGYDGLNRPIWRNTSNTPSGAYVTYSYDGSPTSNGLGHLTAEVFRGSAGTGANHLLRRLHLRLRCAGPDDSHRPDDGRCGPMSVGGSGLDLPGCRQPRAGGEPERRRGRHLDRLGWRDGYRRDERPVPLRRARAFGRRDALGACRLTDQYRSLGQGGRDGPRQHRSECAVLCRAGDAGQRHRGAVSRYGGYGGRASLDRQRRRARLCGGGAPERVHL